MKKPVGTYSWILGEFVWGLVGRGLRSWRSHSMRWTVLTGAILYWWQMGDWGLVKNYGAESHRQRRKIGFHGINKAETCFRMFVPVCVFSCRRSTKHRPSVFTIPDRRIPSPVSKEFRPFDFGPSRIDDGRVSYFLPFLTGLRQCSEMKLLGSVLRLLQRQENTHRGKVRKFHLSLKPPSFMTQRAGYQTSHHSSHHSPH